MLCLRNAFDSISRTYLYDAHSSAFNLSLLEFVCCFLCPFLTKPTCKAIQFNQNITSFLNLLQNSIRSLFTSVCVCFFFVGNSLTVKPISAIRHKCKQVLSSSIFKLLSNPQPAFRYSSFHFVLPKYACVLSFRFFPVQNIAFVFSLSVRKSLTLSVCHHCVRVWENVSVLLYQLSHLSNGILCGRRRHAVKWIEWSSNWRK